MLSGRMGVPKRNEMNMRQRYWGCWRLRQLQPVLTLVCESPLLSVGPRARKGQW
jgi:hypothetical protein